MSKKKSGASGGAGEYQAQQIQVLEGLEPVRRRPGMYIGSTDVRGLHHLIWELVDNAVDEAMAGFCTEVEVTLHADGSASVKDNGRGIPVDMHPTEKKSALEVVFTKLHAGGKFGGGGYKVAGGLHGVGASVVNALSEKLTATVDKDGATYVQSYIRGIPEAEVKKVGKTKETGTHVRFWPDPEIFPDRGFLKKLITDRLRELAFLNKGLIILFREEATEETKVFYFEGGIAAFVRYLNEGKDAVSKIFYVDKEAEGTNVEIALQYQSSIFVEHLLSFANNINTVDGGTHVTGFRLALTATLNKYARKANLLKDQDINLTGEDVREGLTAIVSVKVVEPQFEGQTKGKLGSSEVTGRVSTVFQEALNSFLEENPSDAKRIIELCMQSARARVAANKARELVQRKSLLESATLPGKLSDCSEKDPTKCEVYLVEGDSAGGTAKMGRDRVFQAIMPLKGKILNVEKARIDKILGNEEIKNLITALGTGFGDAFDVSKLRYHRVIIMTDADVDGSHIRTLILTLFWRYLRPLVDGGFVYLAQPPLYQIKKGKKVAYAFSDEERDRKIKEVAPDGKAEIQRYKGLGEMDAEQLWETTMDPDRRTLLKVMVGDTILADELFEKLMGTEVEPRKRFIQAHAKTVRNLDI